MTLTTGQLLAQRYRLGALIAVGGMGEVWAATDTRLDRSVAVKVLKPELSGDPEFRQRFHTEARLTALLNHPGIAAIYDYGETVTAPSELPDAAEGTAFLVMELVSGDSLATILMRHPRLSADHTLDILEQAAEALQAAHERGLVHRDIKPGNILITPTGKVKLTDFGIAKAANAAPVTRQGMVMGTAHYIAPEQASGDEAGPASDVYSLGVVGYECLAGQRPFLSDNAITVAMMHIRDPVPPLPPDIPPGVRALIEIALIKDPRQRYHIGGEFAAAAAAIRAGYPAPLPAGMASTTLHPDPYPARTALLSTGSRSGPSAPGPAPSGPPGSGPPPRTPTALHPALHPPPRHPPPRPRSTRRATIAAVALLVVLGLVLGGYAIRDALHSPGLTPGAGTTAAAPEPIEEPEPTTEPETTTEEPSPEPRDTQEEEVPEGVSVNLADYLLQAGDVAAATATDRGLEPVVVDAQGNEIDSEDLSECWITGVDPPFGSLPVGSPLELTCTEKS
jgi:serine/threonine-protein kinase